MSIGRDVARGMLVIAAAAALGALGACNVPEMVRFPDYVGPAGPAQAQEAAAAESSPPAPPPAPAEAAGPLRVAVPDAILLALQNNRAFIVDRYNTPITRTAEQQQLAAFDPDLTGTFSIARGFNQVDSPPPEQTELGLLGLSEFLPTGTLLNLSAGETVMKWPAVLLTNYPALPGNYATTVSLTATQSLLRGYGLDVNLASLRQARLDTRSSEYELRGFAESLVAQTEEAYWDCALARQQIQITQKSLDLANDELRETLDRIRLGNVAASERVAAEAEVALRQEDLIDARSAYDTARLALLRLLSPSGNTFERDLELLDHALREGGAGGPRRRSHRGGAPDAAGPEPGAAAGRARRAADRQDEERPSAAAQPVHHARPDRLLRLLPRPPSITWARTTTTRSSA